MVELWSDGCDKLRKPLLEGKSSQRSKLANAGTRHIQLAKSIITAPTHSMGHLETIEHPAEPFGTHKVDAVVEILLGFLWIKEAEVHLQRCQPNKRPIEIRL
jgi:hypothetical protein